MLKNSGSGVVDAKSALGWLKLKFKFGNEFFW